MHKEMSNCKTCKYQEDDLPRCETCGEGYMNFEPKPDFIVKKGPIYYYDRSSQTLVRAGNGDVTKVSK